MIALVACGPKVAPRPANAPPPLTCPDGTDEVLDGVYRQFCARSDGTKHGPWLEWHPSGRKAEEGTWEDGRRAGTWTRWADSGLVVARGAYEAGRKHGPWAFAYDDGQLQLVGTFVAGDEHGPWTAYWPDGSVMWSGSFDGGDRVGQWTWNHPNGLVAATGAYEQGDGWTFFDTYGEPLDRVAFTERFPTYDLGIRAQSARGSEY